MHKFITSTIAVGSVLGALFVTTSAQTISSQPLYGIGDMIPRGIQACLAEGRPNAFCDCYVHRWVGLWDAQDRVTWSQTGQSTPHMFQMQFVAAQQCGGRL
jgi:hypothetical protein